MLGLELLIRATRNGVVNLLVNECIKALEAKVIKGDTIVRSTVYLPKALEGVNEDVQLLLERQGISLNYYLISEDANNDVVAYGYRFTCASAANYAASSGNQCDIVDGAVVKTKLGELLDVFNNLQHASERFVELNPHYGGN